MSGPWSPPAGGNAPASNRRTAIVVGVIALVFIVALIHLRHVTQFGLIYYCVLFPSIILHEVSHGAVANVCGDDTAKRAGRLTLNPLKHIDPFGSIVLPALMVLSGSGVAFGYAKPVPVNMGRLRHPRNQGVLVSLAGPATNAVLFVACALLFRYSLDHHWFLSPTSTTLPLFDQVLYEGGLANIVLGCFNLIPLPPLDGSVLVERLLPARAIVQYHRIRPYGMVVVFLLVLVSFHSQGLQNHIANGEYRIWSSVAG